MLSCTVKMNIRKCDCRLMSSKVDSFVRNAQAAEIFRSSFFNSRNKETLIPVEDLDQLIVRENVRPSLLLAALEVTGTGLGVLSRFAPQSISSEISAAVDDAAVQQFNDSIRDMQLGNVENIDVKETLKYHRELRGLDTSENETENFMNQDDEAQQNPTTTNYMDAKGVLTSVFYHALKTSGKF